MFDFDKAAAAIKTSPVLQLITLAPSGGGKSILAGTSGLKTLYVHGIGENHGYESARISGGDLIVPFRWDIDDAGKEIKNPDAQYKRLTDVLSATDQLVAAGFGFVVVDSATEVEALIKGTTRFTTLCTHNGKYNNFKESEACLSMFRPILNSLKSLSILEIGYNMTLILNVKKMDDLGIILESSPKLYGYGVAEGVIQQFPDIVVVSPIMHPETEEIAHRIYFNAGVSRTQKDMATGVVKKTINFSPRITGVPLQELPEGSMAANLEAVLELKRGL
jgi:hypothetical protein